MKHFYRHYHMHEMKCPSVTFHVVIDPDMDTMTIAWAICNGKDNFARSIGREIADHNLAHNIYLEGKRHKDTPLLHDIYDILNDATFFEEAWKGPKANPEHFREKALQAMEEFHFTQAFLESIREQGTKKKSLYWDVVIPALFKSKVVQKYVHG